MRRLPVLFVLAALIISACSGFDKADNNDLAAKAAKSYYDSLLAGGYGYFVSGIHGFDSLPPSYREQLTVNAKQFAATLKSQGTREIRIVNVKEDSLTHITNVFLTLCYGDSLSEEIVVPMVFRDNEWKMR